MMTNVHIFKHKTFYERGEITVTTYSLAFGNDIIEPKVVDLTLAHFNNSGKYISTEYVKSYSIYFFQQLYAQLYNKIWYSADLDLFMAGSVMVDVIGNIYSDVLKVLEYKVLPLMTYDDDKMFTVDLSKDDQLATVTINTIRVLQCLQKEDWIHQLEELPMICNMQQIYDRLLVEGIFFSARMPIDKKWAKDMDIDYIDVVTSQLNLKHPYNSVHNDILNVVKVFKADLNNDFTLTPKAL